MPRVFFMYDDIKNWFKLKNKFIHSLHLIDNILKF